MRFPKTGLTHIVFDRLNVSEIRRLVDMEFLGGFMLDGKSYYAGLVSTKDYKLIAHLVL